MRTKTTTKDKILLTSFMLIFVFAAIIFFAIGIYKIRETLVFNTNSIVVTGKIVDVYATRNGTHTYYYYKVNFVAVDGNSYTSEVGANIARVSIIGLSLKNINEDITVRYDTLKPSHIEMDNDLSVWFLPIVFTLVGFILIIVLGKSLVRLWKKA